MPGIGFENFKLLNNYHSKKNVIYFVGGSGNKGYLNIFSTLCFSLIFTREIISRKPNIILISINFIFLAPSQLQITGPKFREFLPHCLMGTCQHFCLTVF